MSVWLEKRNSISPILTLSETDQIIGLQFSKTLIFGQILPFPVSTTARKNILTNLNVLSQLFWSKRRYSCTKKTFLDFHGSIVL